MEMKFCRYDAGHMTKVTAMPIYGKNPSKSSSLEPAGDFQMWYNYLKILFPGTSGSISMKLGMKHQSFKLIIFCSNDNPLLILTYFTARSTFETSAFIWENVTMIDTLEMIASCDLELGLNEEL